jgi:hypothetical protein
LTQATTSTNLEFQLLKGDFNMADEVVVPVAPKPWYQSKTIWVNALGLVAMIVPQSAAFIAEHFSAVGIGWSLINVVLRLITKGKIEIA